MITFGAPAWSAERLAFVESLGFDFAEIDLRNSEKQRKWWESGIRNDPDNFPITAHGPLGSGPENTDFNYTRRHDVPAVKAAIDAAVRLSISKITFHFCMIGSSQMDFKYKERLSQLKELMDYAKQNNVIACIENEEETADDMAVIISEIPDVNVTVDVGHANIVEYPDHITKMIEVCGQNIQHIHMHDNNGWEAMHEDCHFPLGEGKIDFKKVFSALKSINYDGTITLEINRNLKDSLNLARSLIRNT